MPKQMPKRIPNREEAIELSIPRSTCEEFKELDEQLGIEKYEVALVSMNFILLLKLVKTKTVK